MKAINKRKEQLKKIKDQKKKLIEKLEREEKSGKVILLRDNLDDIFMVYDMNISLNGEKTLNELANDERMINYKMFFLKIR